VRQILRSNGIYKCVVVVVFVASLWEDREGVRYMVHGGLSVITPENEFLAMKPVCPSVPYSVAVVLALWVQPSTTFPSVSGESSG